MNRVSSMAHLPDGVSGALQFGPGFDAQPLRSECLLRRAVGLAIEIMTKCRFALYLFFWRKNDKRASKDYITLSPYRLPKSETAYLLEFVWSNCYIL